MRATDVCAVFLAKFCRFFHCGCVVSFSSCSLVILPLYYLSERQFEGRRKGTDNKSCIIKMMMMVVVLLVVFKAENVHSVKIETCRYAEPRNKIL